MHTFHQEKNIDLPAASTGAETSHVRETAELEKLIRSDTRWMCTAVLLAAAWVAAYSHIRDASIEADTNQGTPGIAYENGKASIVYMDKSRYEIVLKVLVHVRPLVTELNTLLQSGELTPPKAREYAELAINIKEVLGVLNEKELRATRLTAVLDATEDIAAAAMNVHNVPKLAEEFSMATKIFEMDPSEIPGAKQAVITDRSNLHSFAGEIRPSRDYYQYDR